MTTEELRALIAECEAVPAEHKDRITKFVHPDALAELARDALRFQHVTRKSNAFYSQVEVTKYVTRGEWVTHIAWMFRSPEKLDLRAAIDADMGEAP